ncbi:hypothetical protein KY345_01835, partial [Candidatus Woesearchaeota archaeon]|nr:hypothetical protein [Candidatus Woesearchaeota archaeon]
LKDGKERVESVSEQGEAITIFHGSTMYAWDVKTKQGIMVDLKKLDEMDDSSEVRDVGEMNAMAVDAECESVKVSDSMFEIPEDVQFIDFAEMIQQMKDAFEE